MTAGLFFQAVFEMAGQWRGVHADKPLVVLVAL